jgi:hypothetical protein
MKVQRSVHNSPPLIPLLDYLGRRIELTTSYPISWRSILILSSSLNPGLPSIFIPFGFPTKHLYAFLFSCFQMLDFYCKQYIVNLRINNPSFRTYYYSSSEAQDSHNNSVFKAVPFQYLWGLEHHKPLRWIRCPFRPSVTSTCNGTVLYF